MKERADLALVKPGGRLKLFGSLGRSLSGFAPPLDIGLLAAFVRQRGYSVRIIDADAEFLTPEETAERIIQYNPVLAGIFAHTIRMTHAGETVKILKDRAGHIKTLLGGRHPSALPEKTLLEDNPDFVCQGEPFYPVVELLEFLRSKDSRECRINGIWYRKDGRLVSSPPPPLIKNLDELPFIAWDLLPVDRYRAHNWQCFDNLENRQPYAIIYTSIGCPYRCTYCCVNAAYGGPGIRYRDPKKVAQEVDLLVKRYNVRNIRMVDDVFNFNRGHVISVCDEIIKLGHDINIWSYVRVDLLDEVMLSKMRKAGIRWVGYGIEAGDEKVRKGVSKMIAVDKIEKGVEMLRRADIYSNANFVFGLPDDDLGTMQETLDMAKAFNFEYVNFYVAMAWPGSKLYLDAAQRGVDLPKNWGAYAQLSEDTLPLPTKHISAAEVLRFRDKAFMEYFSSPWYIRMMGRRFGPAVVEHIEDMLKHKINRKFA